MAKTMISARVDTALNEKLEEIAKYSQRSKAFLITEALQNLVDREAWLEERISAAEKAADECEHWTSMEALDKWISSIGTPEHTPMPEADVYKPKRKA